MLGRVRSARCPRAQSSHQKKIKPAPREQFGRSALGALGRGSAAALPRRLALERGPEASPEIAATTSSRIAAYFGRLVAARPHGLLSAVLAFVMIAKPRLLRPRCCTTLPNPSALALAAGLCPPGQRDPCAHASSLRAAVA